MTKVKRPSRQQFDLMVMSGLVARIGTDAFAVWLFLQNKFINLAPTDEDLEEAPPLTAQDAARILGLTDDRYLAAVRALHAHKLVLLTPAP